MTHKKLNMFMLIATVALFAGCASNQPPDAQAGPDQTVDMGENVALRGSASDPDGMVQTYRWEQVDGPSVSLSNANQASASFVAPTVKGTVTLTFRLTAVDDKDATATDDIVVTVMGASNQPPNAQAGSDQTVAGGDKVRLRGSASDPDGTVQTYRWEQVSGSSVSISNADQVSASFVAPEATTGAQVLTFRLTAVDDNNATATDDVVVTIAKYGRLGIALSGTVKNHSTYRGISDASITIGQYQGENSRKVGETKTNKDGNYSVQVRVDLGRLTVNANAAGFAPQSIIVDVSDGSRRTADLAMIPVQVTQPFQPENNAAIQVDGQTVVSLSANVLMTESGGTASGQATARVTVLDASKDPSVMPGDMEQWNADTGEAEPIESFGAMNVEFTGANGSRLNLASGKQANISIPLASGRRPEDSPKSIPLYYWSDATGYWVEEGTATLERTADGKWAYTGSVGHFSTWNADVLYESITMKGCVQDQQGNPVRNAEVTAHGKDYVGSSKATTDANGRFEIAVRPDSELELSAAAGSVYSDAQTMRTEGVDLSLSKCLTVTGDRGIRDFPMKIKGATGSLDICVRDHECEDGDKISVDVEGRSIFSGEIVNGWDCQTIEVLGGETYVVELTALNGTGYKGDCSYADANSGEIRVTGENTETQSWRHRGGAGSKARLIVETIKPPFPMPEMVVIPAGSFRMGDLTGDGRFSDGSTGDLPVRQVTIREPFEMGKFEVTVAQFNAFLRANGWEVYVDEDRYGNHPITGVNLESAKKYAKWLSEQTGGSFRLPSEAEWEYAARAGTETNFYWGNIPSGQHANGDQYGRPPATHAPAFKRRWNRGWPDDGYYLTAPVGTFIPNAFGLYDMIGNVEEITENGMLRGGSYDSMVSDLRSSARNPLCCNEETGFRLVREIED
ncbi:SUMF1/EgtB/PvdO family nonheme iron enzyme [Candidatus Poribacteria bacterium]|nr:SUMF1/EgtB/PvdO family nonheme iron enzyme [Candidatus Poribacteria bacterium]